jgi:SAM-dependent methyltransferase
MIGLFGPKEEPGPADHRSEECSMNGSTWVPLPPPSERPAAAPATPGFLAAATGCPWCGSRVLEPFADRAPFHLDSCRTCGVAFVNPQPGDALLAEHYPKGYYATDASSPAVKDHLRWKRYDVRRLLPQIGKLAPGRWLDVGAGIGGALVAAREAGFEVEGVELSAEAAKFGSREFGVTIHPGTLDDFSIAAESYSVISLFHVFEHLRDPAHELERLVGLLRPGGALVIESPSLESLSAGLFGDRWFHLEVPRHLFHFTSSALARRFEEQGLRAERLGSHHPAHGAASFFGSLFPPKSGLPLWRKVVRRSAFLATKAVAPLAASIESATGRGSVLRVIGWKPA